MKNNVCWLKRRLMCEAVVRTFTDNIHISPSIYLEWRIPSTQTQWHWQCYSPWVFTAPTYGVNKVCSLRLWLRISFNLTNSLCFTTTCKMREFLTFVTFLSLRWTVSLIVHCATPCTRLCVTCACACVLGFSPATTRPTTTCESVLSARKGVNCSSSTMSLLLNLSLNKFMLSCNRHCFVRRVRSLSSCNFWESSWSCSPRTSLSVTVSSFSANCACSDNSKRLLTYSSTLSPSLLLPLMKRCSLVNDVDLWYKLTKCVLNFSNTYCIKVLAFLFTQVELAENSFSIRAHTVNKAWDLIFSIFFVEFRCYSKS